MTKVARIIICKLPEKRFLLLQRVGDDRAYPWNWCLPGGKQDKEDDGDLYATANRELIEETGLGFDKKNDVRMIAENKLEPYHAIYFYTEMNEYIQPIIGEGTCGLGWFTWEEIEGLAEKGILA